MIKSEQKLAEHIFDESVIKLPTRDGLGHGLVEAGKKDPRVVVLCADLLESTRVEWFRKEFPERYIEIGVAEQNLATVASGLAAVGKIPFITSYATFSPGRNNEQIRTTIALNNMPVKIAGSHAGISVGPDGATHQALEDIGLMRMLPNMTVIVPCDAIEAQKATTACAQTPSPTYLRFGRSATPVVTTTESPFEIGRAEILWESDSSTSLPQVALIVCGSLVHNALLSAKKLQDEGIGSIVVNNHTVKPMDEKTILDVATKCGAIVTIEEHQIAGGMGSAVAELLAQKNPVPMEFIGMHDEFGQSGEPDELTAYYKMDVSGILSAVKTVLERRK